MEHQISSSPTAAEPERPGWLRVTWWTLLALLFSGLLLAFGAAGLSFVGLGPTDYEAAVHGRWPWEATDLWSFVADLGWLTASSFLIAWTLRAMARGWSDDWDMRLWPIAVAAAISADTTAPSADGGAAGMALLIVVARQVALTATPAPRWRPRRTIRWAVASAAAVVTLATLSYPALHPLSYAFEGRPSAASFGIGSTGGGVRVRQQLDFMLGNEGIGDLTVRSIAAVGGAAVHATLETARIAHREPILAHMRLTPATCERMTSDIAEVRALDVRYETLGLTHTQRLPIDPPARLRCRGA